MSLRLAVYHKSEAPPARATPWEEIKQRTEPARRSEELHDVVNTVPAAGDLNGGSILEENSTKRIDFRTNFLAAVNLTQHQ